VRDALAEGIPVVPIPGPCAAITALSAAGLPTDRFVFEGFLPARQSKRREKLLYVIGEERVIIFYETSNRLAATLSDIGDVMGEREIVIARELTKIHEEFMKGSAAELLITLEGLRIRGEVVLLVAPGDRVEKGDDIPVADLLLRYTGAGGLSLKDAVRRVATELSLPRGEVYAEALRLKGGE
jgi:16S rRNA (cytidine1402-2'-O)-methyltransferase